jgi:hypothetical protein
MMAAADFGPYERLDEHPVRGHHPREEVGCMPKTVATARQINNLIRETRRFGHASTRKILVLARIPALSDDLTPPMQFRDSARKSRRR